VCKVLDCDGVSRRGSRKTTILCKGYCARHYYQIKVFGRIKRTRFDENEITINGKDAYMQLYDKYGNLTGVTVFDKIHLPLVIGKKWRIGAHGYVMTANGLKLNNLVMNNFSDQIVDHKNLKKLDNRDSNLRLATPSQNSCNRKKNCNNKTGFKGVFVRRGDICAKIVYNNKSIEVGPFGTIIEAARKYNELAKIYHGEFARLNRLPLKRRA